MSVDFDAIARNGRCDVSSLRLALPLLEQGYTPPFLARYRRDELSGIDEASLWALSKALEDQRELADHREQLKAAWEETALRDPAIRQAIDNAQSQRVLARLERRLKLESTDADDDSTRLAVRVLNPKKGDGNDFAEIASKVDGIDDAQAAVAGLDRALAKRLIGDPRMMAAATRWLAKNARIHIEDIHDPHLENAQEKTRADSKQSGKVKSTGEAPKAEVANLESTSTNLVDTSPTSADASGTDSSIPDAATPEGSGADLSAAASSAETATQQGSSSDATRSDGASSGRQSSDAEASETQGAETRGAETQGAEIDGVRIDGADASVNASATETEPSPAKVSPNKPSTPKLTKPPAPPKPKPKKISPRQRRRRWLVSVLKPLKGKRFKSDKLSSFQILMLGRALRSQVARCAFEYDATRLVAEIQRTASSMNRPLEAKLRDLVLEYEADIREAAESAWWDDLAHRASTRLATVMADHLRRHVNRGGVDAQVVMSIDAVGPRTAAAAIVASDGRVLHCEDIPCQASTAQRSQAVTKMGELIHNHHVDLIVISNGPARRATMIALGDLIKQSPEKSVRWTLADRSGADAYSGSPTSDQEMRSTPRRFRAAAWLAFSVLQPAQAITKVDPLKLRLSSFQRELSDEAVRSVLEDVLTSGASRGGVDANAAPASWLARLPGMNAEIASAIDKTRRQSLFASRDAIAELPEWTSVVQSRQAIPFLRVFASEQPLDGTLVHPDDYPLAHKLAKSLEIELPPNAPPGYQPPTFEGDTGASEPTKLTEVPAEQQEKTVEQFGESEQEAPEFQVPEDEVAEGATAADHTVGEGTAVGSDTKESGLTETHPADATDPSADVSASSTTAEPDVPAELSSETENNSSESNVDDVGTEVAGETASSAPPENADANASTDSPGSPDVHAVVKRPLPDQAKIDKCIKEWQIGANRAKQIVHWLCDPFGDSDVSGTPPTVMTSLPTTAGLKPGDAVIGVVVSVMPFGVFVELAPDCSGLVHVSRVSESFVEDLHEAVQVGDIISGWVVGIDEKRRRVSLSAIHPDRAKALEDQRRGRGDRGGRQGGPRGRATQQRGGGKPAQAGAGRGKPVRGGGPGGSKTGGGGRGQAKQGRRGDRSRSDRARGGSGRGRQPESYRVESKDEVQPITEQMQKGEEPMRSFGDLAQFFGTSKSAVPPKQTPPSSASVPQQESKAKEASASHAADLPSDEVRSDGGPAVDEPSDGTSSGASDQSDSKREIASSDAASTDTSGTDTSSAGTSSGDTSTNDVPTT